jgi:O-glycosyl hydrolase
VVRIEAVSLCRLYISSPQNEPDYNTSFQQTCHFREVESFNYAGYYRAAQEIYDAIISDTRIVRAPGMIGPESFGFDSCLGQFPVGGGGRFHAIANHLYASGDANSPNSFNAALAKTKGLASRLGMQNVWMSEFAKLSKFEHQDPLNLAILMHNAFTIGNVTAYLHWDGAWAAAAPNNEGTMILVENPYADKKTWTNPAGYTVLMNFWWFKHFSNCVRPGYRRVHCDTAPANVLVSAWTGPYGEFAVILINTGSTQVAMTMLQIPTWIAHQTTDIYFTTLDQAYTYAGMLSGNAVTLRPTSITSIFSYNKPV